MLGGGKEAGGDREGGADRSIGEISVLRALEL